MKKTREALSLMNSMILSGEAHSNVSRKALEEAMNELSRAQERLKRAERALADITPLVVEVLRIYEKPDGVDIAPGSTVELLRRWLDVRLATEDNQKGVK